MKIVIVSGTNACGKSSISRELLRFEEAQGSSPETVLLPKVGDSRCGFTHAKNLRILFPGLYYNASGEEIACGGLDTISNQKAYDPLFEEAAKRTFDVLWVELLMLVPSRWEILRKYFTASRLLVIFDNSLELCLERVSKRSGKSWEELTERGGHVIEKFTYLNSLYKRLITEDPPEGLVVLHAEDSPQENLARILAELEQLP